MRGAARARPRRRGSEKSVFPLSFHHDFRSRLWKQQIEACRRESSGEVAWVSAQLRRVVDEHQRDDTSNIHEADLLRAAGALSVLGLDLSPYLTKGYDCPRSCFKFADLPAYTCPVEIKKRSARFDYQIARYPQLPRAMILCVEHDLVNQPEHVDVLELATLADYLTE
jgi:hypothetical protein